MKNLKGLAQNTKSVLVSLSDLRLLESFTFVGGSALSIHLRHRLSEDLDFFSWKDELEKEELLQELRELFKESLHIENIGRKQLDLKIEKVKVTFFANNWDQLAEKEKLVNHIGIAGLKVLTGMKLNTLFLRAKFRDYYDLYVINQQIYSIKQMYDIIKGYMPEINKKLFQTALTYVDDIEEDNISHLDPIYNIDVKEIKKNFDEKIFAWIHGSS